jgi:transposase-like protein
MTKKSASRYSPEVRQRTVQMALQRYAARRLTPARRATSRTGRRSADSSMMLTLCTCLSRQFRSQGTAALAKMEIRASWSS